MPLLRAAVRGSTPASAASLNVRGLEMPLLRAEGRFGALLCRVVSTFEALRCHCYSSSFFLS